MTSYLLIGGVVLVAAWAIWTWNRFVRLGAEADAAFSNIDVQLKRRADLLPNLAEAVRGYASHERETFEAVTRARTLAGSAHGAGQLAAADEAGEQAAARLLAVAEGYPELQASANFLQLQRELAHTEDLVAAARRYHNSVVRRLNTLVGTVPPMIVARATGVTEREYFRVERDDERSPVLVRLDASPAGGATP